VLDRLPIKYYYVITIIRIGYEPQTSKLNTKTLAVETHNTAHDIILKYFVPTRRNARTSAKKPPRRNNN